MEEYEEHIERKRMKLLRRYRNIDDDGSDADEFFNSDYYRTF